MARTCGIRIGPRHYEIVVLEGTPKKPIIAAFKAGKFSHDIEDPAITLKAAAAELGVPKEGVGLVVDSGHAAFRRVTLPLVDQSKIEQVLKYEVESELPQWEIDDVIADYLVLADNDASSDLLVTAVPKDSLAESLELCTRAGVEPFEAELETTAMVNAALHAELCPIDSAQLLVHVGEQSTSVVVMDGGKVAEMRVVHLGAPGLPPTSGPPTEETEETPGDGAAAAPEETPPEIPTRSEGERMRDAILRIRRELGRSLSSARTRNEIDAVYVCGIELPGLVGSDVMDIPVHPLDCFAEGDGHPEEGHGQLVVAYGAALREMGGGVLNPRLRREELTYAGTWERVEFPIAVASLLLATVLAVVFILQQKELHVLNYYGAGHWLNWSNTYMMGNPRKGQRGNLSPPPETVSAFIKDLQAGALDAEGRPLAADNLAATKHIDALLRRAVSDLKKDLGEDASIEQPQSALVGAYLVLDLFEKHQKDWRPSIRRIEASTQGMGRSGKKESVMVTLTFVLIADDVQAASSNYEALLTELSQQSWHLSSQRSGLNSLENDKGLLVERMPIEVDVSTFYEQQRLQAQGAAQ